MITQKLTWLGVLTATVTLGLPLPFLGQATSLSPFVVSAPGLVAIQAANDGAPTHGSAVSADSQAIAQRAEAEEPTAAPDQQDPARRDSASRKTPRDGISRDAVVVFGQNVEIKAGDTAEVVVVIGGSAKIHGKVREAVVVIGGDIEVDGEVEQEVVAVMGSIRARPSAVINGDVVSVGGRLDVEEGAQIKGHAQEVAITGMNLPRMDWIQQWLANCVMMLRPLAPQVGWVWIVAFVYFLLYLLIAAVFRHPVQCCLDELTRRPATTFLMGLLTKLLLPLAILILIVLVVGIVVVPFLVAALFVLGMVGKVAVLEWIGFKIGSLFGREPLQQPVVALIIGSAVLALLYMIPVVGLLTMLLLSVWSLGCAITAAFGGFRRELPDSRPPTSSPSPFAGSFAENPAQPGSSEPSPVFNLQPSSMPATAAPPTLPPGMSEQPQPGGPVAQTAPADGPATAPLPGSPPVMPDVLVYPKATFWERMAAAFLDVVLVVLVGSMVHMGPPGVLIIALAYVAGLWTWRGTTIGGIVLGLKVVRMDGQPVSFVVALVRGLAAGFSAFVLFLGFFWIAWDPERQGWHDKIAGTVVLRLPRGTPLVCL